MTINIGLEKKKWYNIRVPVKPVSSLSEAIKSVAVGKTGSRNIEKNDSISIVEEIKTGSADPVKVAALFTALKVKGIADGEKPLIEYLGHDAFKDSALFLVNIGQYQGANTFHTIFDKLLNEEVLTSDEQETVSKIVFDTNIPEPLRVIFTTVLRMNYAPAEQYASLYRELMKTINPGFQNPWPGGVPVLQFAEPFDGVSHSHLLTPLLMNHFQKRFRCFAMVGRSSGPKFGNNLLDISREIERQTGGGVKYIHTSSDSLDLKPVFGYYLDQKLLSETLDDWVDLRIRMQKRPFMATLEKYINPFKSKCLISSAFHGPFGEKMIEIAEHLGFESAIIIRKGREGSLSFSLSKPVEVY